MSILAVIAIIWTLPIETVHASFDSSDKVLAGDDSVWHLADLCSGVRVNVDVCFFSLLNCQVVTVFALFALLTHSSFEVTTESFLVVDYSK